MNPPANNPPVQAPAPPAPVAPAVAAPAANPVAQTVYVSFSAQIDVTTSEVLIATMADLAVKGVPHVYLLMSTPGGMVMSGLTLYNTLRAMPFTLTTHNVGNVDSIGNPVFLAGEHRYACDNATFMFHGVGRDVQSVRLEQRNLKESLDAILHDEKRIGAIIQQRTGMNVKETLRLFKEARTKDAAFALAKGLIHDIREVNIPAGAPILSLVFKR